MNSYEARRQEKIKQNQALLASLDIEPVVPRKAPSEKPPASKRRKLAQPPSAPSRTSARIAAAPVKPVYDDEPDIKPRRVPNGGKKKPSGARTASPPAIESTLPSKDVDAIKAGWTSWEPTGPEPTRDEDKKLHFADHETFTPNKTPEEMLREGAFGGSYYRPLYTRKLAITVDDDWKEIPEAWLEGLDVARYLTSSTYDADVNKFKVSCGQSIEEWEAAGWIAHEYDVRGWFQWYIRFYQGRRCDDDERQISRWRKCVGETGRWRRMLLKKYMGMGVREVFDDGEDEREVSPVMHQTCHHWAYEVRQGDLDEYWTTGR